ncbi:MAG: DUF814 domain-containing protein [Candidatus Altiarchaeota archaeon]|nr:DUF814 domain-containing protein [Candidatus Altiarchaeota archaeon]
METMEFKIDTRKSIPENAEHYYQEAKKAQKKVEGARKALQDTLKKKERLEGERKNIKETNIPEKKEKKERKWYDSFRWFTSSDGFLVIGGKDAATNEILIKKHLEKGDLVFHADVQGAPFFVVKNPENKEIPTSTLDEAAEMAASYSKAWQAGWGSCDVYYVNPEQVSKTTKAGEYLTKGAFMIYGKKNWFKRTELKIGIGSKGEEIIGGPVSMIEKGAKYSVKIGPGEKKSKQLAEDIRKKLLEKAGKEEREKIKATGLEEIQKWIPAGKGRVKE